MQRNILLSETANIRRSILEVNPTLVANKDSFVLGEPPGHVEALQFALHLLDYADRSFDNDQGAAVTSMGIAIGLMVSKGLVVKEREEPDLLMMKQANAMPA